MWRSEKTKNAVLQTFGSETELVVFDVETTGFSSEKDRVIKFSGIKFLISDGTLTEIKRFDTYINPQFPLPEKIIEITGITDDILKDAPLETEIFPQIKDFFGNSLIVCGHNVAFDIRFMTAMFERYGYSFAVSTTLDTLEMARDIAGSAGCENNKLGTLSQFYGVDYGLTFHNSMDDVIACSRLLQVFYKEYKEREDERFVMPDSHKTKVKVKSLRYWAGYRGHSRIYIYTDCGDFFYDVFKKTWGVGKSCFYDIDMIDMEQLRADSLKMANATNEREFARFRG